jgi:hypothetical protein
MDTAPLGYVHPVSKTPRPAISRTFLGVSDGIRTHDRLDHNQELYQLSYAHRAGIESSSAACAAEAAAPSEELIHFQLASRCGGAGGWLLEGRQSAGAAGDRGRRTIRPVWRAVCSPRLVPSVAVAVAAERSPHLSKTEPIK